MVTSGASAYRAHQQIVALPALIASMNKANAAAAARQANQLAQIKAQVKTAIVGRAKYPPLRPLSTDEASHVVVVVQSQLQAKLTGAQAETLANELEKPDQQLVDPSLPISSS